MSKELILLDLGTVRIKRFDGENVIVQVLTKMEASTHKNPRTGEIINKPDREQWVDVGYYSNTKSAIRHIYEYDLLIEEIPRTFKEYVAINKEILAKLTKLGL